MSSLPEIQTRLENRSVLAQSLNDLGTLLRDEKARADPRLASIIPLVLAEFKTEPFEVIRVLVNFTADNDENRLFLASKEPLVKQFWLSALSGLAVDTVSHHIVLLLTQFIHNIDTEKKLAISEALLEYGTVEAIANYCKKLENESELDALSVPLELMAEFSSQHPSQFNVEHVEWILQVSMKILDSCDNDECDEMLLQSSQAVLNITNVEDLAVPQTVLLSQIYMILSKVPSQFANLAHIKRNLFSACGNISSYSSYNNFLDLDMNAAELLRPESDLYAAAAAAISIGNCVSSNETQTVVVNKLNELFSLQALIGSVLHRSFGDVVQYQALHLFNNLMTPETADVILDTANYPHLLRITKVVVDNSKYYKEIGLIYFKFLRKLLTTGFTGARNPLYYKDVWDYLGNAESTSGRGEVDMLLLQAIAAGPVAKDELDMSIDIVERLLDETLSVNGTIDSNVLLAKLKTLAMVFQNYTCSDLDTLLGHSRFVTLFAQPFYKFISEVSQSTITTEQNQQGAAIANNTKFVAAAASAKFVEYGSSEDIALQIIEACSAITGR